MGQYHLTVNLDKKEFLDPHKLGAGLKLWEQIANPVGPAQALIALLAASNGRGGGDLRYDDIIGRWRGDRIVIIGDYGAHDDYPMKDDDVPGDKLYAACRDGEGRDPRFTDISDLLLPLLERELDGKFVTHDGWRTFNTAE